MFDFIVRKARRGWGISAARSLRAESFVGTDYEGPFALVTFFLMLGALSFLLGRSISSA